MKTLRSYVEGKWMAGSGPGAKLENPATEEVLAETSTTGIDMHQALAFARDTGGPALRELGFAQRGELLEGMTRAIHGAREELIELAIQNGGNTRSDAKFDIDGATATLQAYAELGKSLGDAKLLVDGEPTDIAGSRLQGWHVLSPRHGVAVHINAFNFPAWGWAEKAACAMLAGMPVVTKPATASALVAWRSAELVVEAGCFLRGRSAWCAARREICSTISRGRTWWPSPAAARRGRRSAVGSACWPRACA